MIASGQRRHVDDEAELDIALEQASMGDVAFS
jgi:hypothetical protein